MNKNYDVDTRFRFDAIGEPDGKSVGRLMAKVYGLLSLTLLVSVMGSYYGMTHTAFVEQHSILIMIGAFVLLFATQLASRIPAIGVPLVFLFAGSMGAVMGPAISMYLKMPDGPTLVAEALGTTMLMFVGLSLYALITRRDFSRFFAFLMTGLIVGIITYLANALFLHLPALQSATAGVLALVFSGFILFDTQTIRHNEDTAVSIVLGLYLDIINLFMALLDILGSGSK